jgi:hypothetical protein
MKNKIKTVKPKAKSTNQKIVSKAAKAVGFKNIKEAKSFLHSSKPKQPEGVSGGTALLAGGGLYGASKLLGENKLKAFEMFKATNAYHGINKEIADLLMDDDASDSYIVERANYLLAKQKNKTACRSSGCTANENKEEVPIRMFVYHPVHGAFSNWLDSYNISVSV